MRAALIVIGLLLTFPHMVVVRTTSEGQISLNVLRATFGLMIVGIGLFFYGLAIR